MNLGDAATVVGFAVQSVSPKLARDIPDDIDPDVFSLDRDEFTGETLAIADHLRLFGLLLPIAAVLLFVAAIALGPDRRVAVLRVGVGVAAAGTLLAVTLLILKARVIAGVVGEDEVTDQEVRDAASGLIDAYLGDLVGWGLLLGLLGVVLAGAAAALDPGDVEAPTRRLARLLERPGSTRGRVLRGVAALVLGIGIVLEPTLALQVAAIAGGAYLVFFGVTELLVLIGRRDRPAAATEAGRAPGARDRGRRRRGCRGGAARGRGRPHRRRERVAQRVGRRPVRGLQRLARALRPPASTRSPSRARTTPSRPPTARAGSSPTSATRSRASSETGSASS